MPDLVIDSDRLALQARSVLPRLLPVGGGAVSVQAEQALERANEVRRVRTAWFRDVRAMSCAEGQVDVATILRQHADGIDSDVLEAVRRTPVLVVLAQVRRRSEHWARHLAAQVGAVRVARNHGLTVGELTAREALVLADALDPKGGAR